jgi:5'-deoxynucleotidase YfbR-like HD superfamily hydrolase
MLELALVHDIAEGKAGDYTVANQLTNPELRKEKATKEAAAMKELKSLLPPPLNTKISALYREYEKRETREAKIVAALDKMEANLQANSYHNGDVRYWKDCENGEQYYKLVLQKKPLVQDIDEKILTELEELIIRISKENMKKHKIRMPKE